MNEQAAGLPPPDCRARQGLPQAILDGGFLTVLRDPEMVEVVGCHGDAVDLPGGWRG